VAERKDTGEIGVVNIGGKAYVILNG